MLANNITVLLIIFFIAIFFVFIAKYQGKSYITALIYAVITGIVGLTQSVSIPLLSLAFVGNFIVSFVLFKILRYFESGFIHILIAIGGCLLLWYLAYLPIGYSVFQHWKELGIVGK